MEGIAILSSGPSVLESWPKAAGEEWSAVVGVSTTCWLFDVDWMCWMDGIAMRGMIERGRKPRIGSVWHLDDLVFWPELKTESYPFFADHRRAYTTLPNAVNWALGKWPTAEVHVFGLDMADSPNAAGLATMTDPIRWKEELGRIAMAAAETGGSDRLRLVGWTSPKNTDFSVHRSLS